MIEILYFLATTFHLSQSYDKERNINKFPTIEREIDNICQGLWKFTRFKSFFRFFFIFRSTSRQIFFLVAFSFSPPLFSLFLYTTVHFSIDINYFTDRAKFNVASTFVSTSENTNSNTSLVDKFKRILLKKNSIRFRKQMFLYPVRRNLSKL